MRPRPAPRTVPAESASPGTARATALAVPAGSVSQIVAAFFLLAAVLAVILLLASPARAGTCSGTLQYVDRLFDISGYTTETNKPCRYVDVFLFTSDLGTELGAGETDGAGTFSFPVTSMGVTDVRLVALADSDNSPWSDRIVVYDSLSSPGVQSVASAAESRDTGTSFTFDSTIPRVSGNSRVGDPFNIIDVFLDSAEEVYLQTGSKTPPLVSYWWDGSGISTGFYSDQSIRFLGGTLGNPNGGDNDGYDDCVILHEYGHFLAYQYSEDDSPGGFHTGTGYYLPTLTWSEGWGNFWVLAVRDSMVYWDATSGDAGFSINFEEGTPSASLRVGMNNESAVAMVLYDIFDDAASDDLTPGTDDDSLDYGLDNIWTVFDGFMDNPDLLVTLLDFSQGWATLFPGEDGDEAFLGRSIEFTADAADTVLLNHPKNVSIPDGQAGGIADGLWASGFSDNITDVRVFVSIRHADISQLRVKVRHPDGTEVLLHNRSGFLDRNLIEWYGYANYSFPAGNLSTLSGKPINGIWELVVSDEVAGTAGEVKAWGLRFQDAVPSSQETGVDRPLWTFY